MKVSVIEKFIETFCTQVRENDNTELIIDDHKCISFGGIEYYVPEISYNKDDSKTYDYLVNNFQL